MGVSKKEKWLYQYSLPCTYGDVILFKKGSNLQKIKKKLGNHPNREEIIDHFLRNHNPETLKLGPMHFPHLVIPYLIENIINTTIECKIYEPFHELPEPFRKKIIHEDIIEEAKKLGVLRKTLKKENILMIHENYIVDVIEKKDIIKYHNLWIK